MSYIIDSERKVIKDTAFNVGDRYTYAYYDRATKLQWLEIEGISDKDISVLGSDGMTRLWPISKFQSLLDNGTIFLDYQESNDDYQDEGSFQVTEEMSEGTDDYSGLNDNPDNTENDTEDNPEGISDDFSANHSVQVESEHSDIIDSFLSLGGEQELKGKVISIKDSEFTLSLNHYNGSIYGEFFGRPVRANYFTHPLKTKKIIEDLKECQSNPCLLFSKTADSFLSKPNFHKGQPVSISIGNIRQKAIFDSYLPHGVVVRTSDGAVMTSTKKLVTI